MNIVSNGERRRGVALRPAVRCRATLCRLAWWFAVSAGLAAPPLTAVAAEREASAPAAPGTTEPAGARPAIDPDDLAAFVDGFVLARMRAQQVVGVTLSIVHDGRLVLARGYGHDDLENGRPVDPGRSLFRPGSISKTFTWTAVMQLQEQGLVDLDADIQSYLPDLQIADTFEQPITLRHLMAHTPGFEESLMGHLFSDDPDAALPLLDYLQRYQPARVRPPGELPAYSNYGVAVAGLIVANVSGLAFEDYVERNLLLPLGMNHSTFREPWTRSEPAPMTAALAQNVSRGYVRRAGAFEPGVFAFISPVGPAGALSTTAADMSRWMLAHLNGGVLDGARILQPATAARMHRQHFTLDPSMPGLAHGFIESHPHGYRAIGHGGGTVHFLSDMQLVPDLGLGVFISTNTSGGGGELIDGFVPALLERYFPPGPLQAVSAAAEAAPDAAVGAKPGRALGEYAGRYLSTRRAYTTVEAMFLTDGVTVSVIDDALVVTTAVDSTRLRPLGGDAFASMDDGTRVLFTSTPEGSVAALLPPQPIMVLQKVGPLQDPVVLNAILGMALAVLACALVGAWLRRGRNPPGQSRGERWAARMLMLTALTWLAALVLGALGLGPIGENFAAVFFAFPPPLFLAGLGVGVAAAVLTLLCVALLVPVWRGRSWSRWRRLRHTGVVLAAALVVLVLHHFNAIGFHFTA